MKGRQVTESQIIKISMDIRSGTFSIEAAPDHFKETMEQVEHFLEKFRSLVGTAEEPAQTPPAAAPAKHEMSGAAKDAPTTKRKKRGTGLSKTGKLEQVDLGLSSPQREELRTFYSSKAPKTQNDKVAVLAFKLKELTGKTEFDANEIHTALKIVSQPTPANLVAVFNNMKSAGMGGYSERKTVVNHLMEDYVSFRMNAGSDE